MEEKIIKYVAIYLRKSRGDEETALDKHKLVLTELCIKNNWKYVLYEEIGSGDNIAMRPVFIRLINDIENKIFDAVVVNDIDRLGRGNQSDQGRINQVFSSSNTFIVTPQQIYNLNNESDEMIVDIRSFVSRQEYKQIVKRLSQGKKIGSMLGNWTNGTPPYPYEYERYNDKYNPKGLVVNDEKLKTYRMIIDEAINEKTSPKNIAVKLNSMNIPSPRNGYWHGVTVYRLLIDCTHLGKIISNKSRGDGHAIKKPSAKKLEKIQKDQWVIVENCHEPVKTQDEHSEILLFLSRVTKAPRRTQQEILPLSGLVKCEKCKHTMGVYKRSDRKTKHTLKPCWYVNEHGEKCGNRGSVLDILYAYIDEDSTNYLNKLYHILENIDINENKLIIEQKIISVRKDIESKNKSLERILEAFENGLYTLNQFKERKEKVDLNIEQLKHQIELLEIQCSQYNTEKVKKEIKRMEFFKANINNENLSDLDKNKLYKTIIDCILWNRDGNTSTIDIKYIQ